MRIIAGKYRGKKLKEFELSTTKPTLDRVKESMFNLIQFDVLNAVVLDLFAGTGALGVEAVSRGAKKTIFIDQNKQAVKIIKENLQGIKEDAQVLNVDSIEFLKTTKEKFDIVLIDPPYKTELGTQAIELIVERDLLNQNGIILFETADEKMFEFNYENYSVDRRKYGTVAVYKIVKN